MPRGAPAPPWPAGLVPVGPRRAGPLAAGRPGRPSAGRAMGRPRRREPARRSAVRPPGRQADPVPARPGSGSGPAGPGVGPPSSWLSCPARPWARPAATPTGWPPWWQPRWGSHGTYLVVAGGEEKGSNTLARARPPERAWTAFRGTRRWPRPPWTTSPGWRTPPAPHRPPPLRRAAAWPGGHPRRHCAAVLLAFAGVVACVIRPDAGEPLAAADHPRASTQFAEAKAVAQEDPDGARRPTCATSPSTCRPTRPTGRAGGIRATRAYAEKWAEQALERPAPPPTWPR